MLSYASNRGEERSRMMITVLHKLKENVVIVVKPGIFKVNLKMELEVDFFKDVFHFSHF